MAERIYKAEKSRLIYNGPGPFAPVVYIKALEPIPKGALIDADGTLCRNVGLEFEPPFLFGWVEIVNAAHLQPVDPGGPDRPSRDPDDGSTGQGH